MVGKYILTHWVNGTYEDKWLRYINRETNKHFISDVNYSLNVGTGYTYSILKNAATKFVKNEDGSFRRSIGDLSNIDGVMTFKVMETPSDIRSKYSFDEIFNIDIRKVLDKNSDTIKKIEHMIEFFKIPQEKIPNFYKLSNSLTHIEECAKWENHLKKLFGVKDIYRCVDYTEEKGDISFIQKELVYMHLNMFSDYREKISMEESHEMATIAFWLFEDKLVYIYCTGKSCW